MLNKIESIVKLKNIEQMEKKTESISIKEINGERRGLKKSCEKISLNKILLNLIDKEENNSKRGRKKSIAMMKGMEKI